MDDALLDALPMGVVVHDTDGAITRWNGSAERILGLSGDELAGRTPADPRWRAVHDDDRPWPGDDHPAMRSLRTGEPVHDELMGVHRPDGTTVWLRVSSAPVVDGDGQLTAVVATFVDVTDRRAELHTIEQSERRFRNAFAGSPMAEAVLDANGRMVDHNASMDELLGLGDGALDELDTWQLVPVDERPAATDLLRRLGTTGEAMFDEYLYMRPDGDTRWVSGRLRTIDWPGMGRCVLVQLIDVTDEHRVRAELARSEERFRVAFASAPVPMSVMDVGGTLLEVNAAWERQIGLTAADVIGGSFERFVEPAEAARLASLVTAMLGDGRRSLVTGLDLFRPDGAVRHVEVHVSIIEIEGAPCVLTQSLDITEVHEQARLLEHIAEHDVLTDLLNRRGFAAAVATRLGRSGAPSGAVIVADIDHFKLVNETRGPLAGDEVIAVLARALRRSLPSHVSLARLGGDEFGVLVPDGDEATVSALAEQIVVTFRDADLSVANVDQPLTASAGVALIDERMLSVDELLAEADLAMYEAKELGRDRYVVAHGPGPDEDESTSGDARVGPPTHVGWAARIERALDDDAFVAVAEPIVSLADGEVVQHELLIRMAGDGDDVIGPADFIRIAERVGMVQRIDAWMAERAMSLLATERDLVLTVNLSTRTMNDPDFLDTIDARIRDLGVDPARLIFEITETAAISNLADARRFTSRLAHIGCRVALDDFGAGFGSFYYLKYLPFDFLKIDGEFVRRAVTSAVDTAIIRSLVGLARELGKQTIAEYTHDAATYEHVKALGVDLAQGRFVGRGVRLGTR